MTAVGVVRNGEILADAFELTTGGHAGQLPELVNRALAEAGVTLEDVDGLAVSVGPGSFTGLRVGLSFAKGVAFSGDCPLVGVGTLDAFATLAPERFATIATLLDARRGESYVATFERTADGVRRCGIDDAVTPEEAFRRVVEEAAARGPAIVLGDAVMRYADAFAGLASESIEVAPFSRIHPRGGAVARLGEARLARGESDRLESLVPVYVRASAAERNAGRTSLTSEKTVS